MKRIIIFVMLPLVGIIWGQFRIVKVQNDWRYGPGLSDTVNNWGARYWTGDGINHALLPMPLMSGTINPTAWVQHPLETGSEVGAMNWGARCADVNEDGIVDIVATIADGSYGHIVWYEGHGSWSFTRHDVDVSAGTGMYYSFSSDSIEFGTRCASIPADVNGDGHVDIIDGDYYGLWIYLGNGTGGFSLSPSSPLVGGYPNSCHHIVDVDAADGDGDGDIDIVAIDFYDYACANSDLYPYDDPAYQILVFWNDGTGNFTTYTVADSFHWSDEAGYDAPNGAYWRVKFADFNGDGTYESLVYEVFDLNGWSVSRDYVEIANRSWSGYSSIYDSPPYFYPDEVDGLWIADFDMDGDQDVIYAVGDQSPGTGQFHVIQNDGFPSFSDHFLFNNPMSTYCDGSIMADMDGDGLNDIVGTWSDVGYMRRTGPGYNDFTEYHIDDAPPDDNSHASHWAYPCNLDGGTDCSGDGDLDLIVVWDNMIMLYENQMISYVPAGSLFSAVLAVPLSFDTCVACSVAWDGCVLDGYTVDVSARIGASLAECNSAPWNGHVTQPWRDVYHGEFVGNTTASNDTVWVQYKITITNTGGSPDRTPTIDSVWVIIYPTECAESCDSFMVNTYCPDTCGFITSCTDQHMQFLIVPTNSITRYPADSEVTVSVSVDGITAGSGTVADLTWATLTADSFLSISPPSGSWNNGDTVQITIASAYSCPYIQTFTCQFVVDAQPPILSGEYPPHDTVVSDSTITITASTFDSIAGVNTDSTQYTVIVYPDSGGVDTIATIPGANLNYTHTFSSGDSVVVCAHMVDNVYANPYDCTCEPNTADTCWAFEVQLCSPIFAQWGCPGDAGCWQYVSCEDQSMNILLWSEDPIDTSRVFIRVNGSPLSPASSNLDFSCVSADCDSVIATISNFTWHDGDSVVIQLDSAYTTTGCLTIW